MKPTEGLKIEKSMYSDGKYVSHSAGIFIIEGVDTVC